MCRINLTITYTHMVISRIVGTFHRKMIPSFPLNLNKHFRNLFKIVCCKNLMLFSLKSYQHGPNLNFLNSNYLKIYKKLYLLAILSSNDHALYVVLYVLVIYLFSYFKGANNNRMDCYIPEVYLYIKVNSIINK